MKEWTQAKKNEGDSSLSGSSACGWSPFDYSCLDFPAVLSVSWHFWNIWAACVSGQFYQCPHISANAPKRHMFMFKWQISLMDIVVMTLVVQEQRRKWGCYRAAESAEGGDWMGLKNIRLGHGRIQFASRFLLDSHCWFLVMTTTIVC